jgi:hypothetical protein
MIHSRAASRLAVTLALLTACSDATPSTEPTREATLELRAQIGANGEHSFNTISQLIATSKYVYVSQRGEQSIMVFRPDGSYVKTIGRAGGGPGEFRSLKKFGVLGDTLWTTDWEQRRLTLFSDTGAVVGLSSIGSESVMPTDTDPGFGMIAETLTPDGFALGWGGFYGDALVRGMIDSIPVLRSTRQGGRADTIGRYAVEYRDLIIQARGSTMFAPQPVSVYDFVIFDGTGGKACVVDRNHPATPTEATASVTCIATSGDTLWHRTLTFDPVPMTAEMADSLRRSERNQWRPHGFLESEIDAAVHIPTHWPPVTEGIAGADGSIWLRGHVVNDSVTYTVLAADGSVQSRVRAPRKVRVLWASGAIVWAEELDDDDVPTLSRYEIAERSAR